MNTRTLSFCLPLLLISLLAGICLAQDTSSGDLLPLAAKNSWTYSFSVNNSPGGGYNANDFGIARLTVDSFVAGQDSIVWTLQNVRDFTRYEYSHGTLFATTSKHDSAAFTLVEFTSDTHAMYTPSTSEIDHTSDAFPFWRLLGDSVTFLRYGPIDSDSAFSIDRCRCTYIPNIYRTVRMRVDSGVTRSSGSWLNAGAGSYQWNYMLTAFTTATTGVGSVHIGDPLPTHYVLHQNSPNPFNPRTDIAFEIPRSSMVTLAVYDLLGRNITTLVEELLSPGVYHSTFDGSRFASGIYICRLEAEYFAQSRKIILLR